jgi:hypothetical protein
MTSLSRLLVPVLLPVLFTSPAFAEEGLGVGIKAPDFVLPNVRKGGETALHDAVSKGIVIVHFWKSK